jgi:hypothetical protein
MSDDERARRINEHINRVPRTPAGSLTPAPAAVALQAYQQFTALMVAKAEGTNRQIIHAEYRLDTSWAKGNPGRIYYRDRRLHYECSRGALRVYFHWNIRGQPLQPSPESLRMIDSARNRFLESPAVLQPGGRTGWQYAYYPPCSLPAGKAGGRCGPCGMFEMRSRDSSELADWLLDLLTATAPPPTQDFVEVSRANQGCRYTAPLAGPPPLGI